MRDRTAAEERGENETDRAVLAQLDKTLPELNFDGVAFADVVDFLRDVTGANVFVNWKALEGAGVEKTSPVSARVRNIKFAKALTIILDSVSGGTVPLGYTIDDGVITISTGEDLDKNTLTRVYDIRDLIIDIPDFTNAPNFSLQSTSQQGQGGGGGGGGGGSSTGLFENADQDRNNKEPTKSKTERGEELVQLVKDLVQPEVWADNGGTATIRYFNGSLIVTAPRSVHEAIGGSWD